MLLLTALMLGCIHALEADHMLAVASFVSRKPSVEGAMRFGARWGFGHAMAVLAAGSILLLLGVRMPAGWDAAAEALVGVMLVGLGAWAITSARRLHAHGRGPHAGMHAHATGREPHIHLDDHDRGGITFVGLLHGLAGTSGAIALLPVTLMDAPWLGVGYLALFGIGVTIAMTAFAAVAAVAMRRAARESVAWARRVATGVGLGAIATGLVWILNATT